MLVEKGSKKIIWFRNNLRTHDASFWNHIHENDEVIAVFCLEPEWFKKTPFGWKKMEVFRAQFLMETLADLKHNLAKSGISFYCFEETASKVFQQLYSYFPFTTILTQNEWTSEEKALEFQIKEQFPEVRWISFYDQFLIEPGNVPFSIEQFPDVFTVYRKKAEQRWAVNELVAKPNTQFSSVELPFSTKIPSVEDLGYDTVSVDERSAFPCKGGETQALHHLKKYIWEHQQILTYKQTRNELVGIQYSTKLSPWLANGSLSPKMIYHEIRQFEAKVLENDSTYWVLFELLWRDFFKCVSLKYGNQLFHVNGILNRTYRWKSDDKAIQDWIHGKTKYDFVNANMLELKYTGWMSNRGRQNVASYFAKEMECDWRIGASYFEALLLDYDVHSNYGNWNYLAGVGNDPRDRKFNIELQAKNYDGFHVYRNLWLPKKNAK
ncbi:DASH family cryptochrome [Flavobacterium aciduliphilum]|uniref:Cryptochrome DASH n=1 Tax=Flavobacterium aciduliphilum TaxID=1101402 RepID=A0A328YJQ0_9FLAO|nr:DASH family cryptochrome [Flavobacterium aciduliphilum]RAR74159.1 deoxyribodipyrimidine photo-lyase (single-stranded DNA-specific) [Flavobacterium aciduliphilum]